ncbi:MAG: hypothetical protein HC845_05540 [Akkermansiaceae bacterium]|nr:hypothetical protein [Akkermansiaceae bacterium]
MNTKPDEETLALWLDDELVGDDLAAVEAWAMTQPEQIQARAEIRSWRKTMSSALPASEEPPYPDFFNHKILQAVREPISQPVAPVKKSFSWRHLLMPVAAGVGMALTFLAGKNSKANISNEVEYANIPRAIPVAEPVLYTPEIGVNADWFASEQASASVIVLNGVAAIPDTMDFSKTVYLPTESEIDSTVQLEAESTTESAP